MQIENCPHIPAKPAHITGLAAEAWDDVVRECRQHGIDLTLREHVLTQYALTWVLWFQCRQAIDAEGQIIEEEHDDRVVIKRNPRMVDYASLHKILGGLRAQLGLTAKKDRRKDDHAEPPRRINYDFSGLN